jgi:hypothetical protein
LEALKQSPCLLDLEEEEKVVEEVKKNCKHYEKEINTISAAFLQFNSYYYHIKETIDKEIVEKKKEPVVDER